MKIRFLVAILTLCFFSCKGISPSKDYHEINCNGIDIISLGDSIENIKTKLDKKIMVDEYEELGSFYVRIQFEHKNFITIGHYESKVFIIGLFSDKYRLKDNIFIGMGLEELKPFIENFKIKINHHDSIEYVEYSCEKGTIKVLVRSKNDSPNHVGIYTKNRDETDVFHEDAIVYGFIIQ